MNLLKENMEKTELQQFKEDLIEQGVNIQQIFSGYIINSDNQLYYVRLYDQTNIHGEDLNAEISRNKFSLPNLKNGTIFYWFLGKDNRKKDFSLIRLTEEKWTEEKIKKISIESKKLFEKLNKLDKTML